MLAARHLRNLTLRPGELYVASRPLLLLTILGSCVGVTIWSPRLGAGALCHGILPRCPRESPPGSSLSDGYRYVDFSIRYLARKFDALGASRQELEVKVFGGADVLPVAKRDLNSTVGAQNRQAALETLAEEGLTVLASDVGGVRGRRVLFNTATGEVLVYRLAAWEDQQR